MPYGRGDSIVSTMPGESPLESNADSVRFEETSAVNDANDEYASTLYPGLPEISSESDNCTDAAFAVALADIVIVFTPTAMTLLPNGNGELLRCSCSRTMPTRFAAFTPVMTALPLVTVPATVRIPSPYWRLVVPVAFTVWSLMPAGTENSHCARSVMLPKNVKPLNVAIALQMSG